MLLDIRPLINFNGLQNYGYAAQWKMSQGDPLTLYFLLVDRSLDQEVNNFYPPGRIYYPVSGQIDRLITSGFTTSSNVAFLSNSDFPYAYPITFGSLYATIILSGASTSWYNIPQPGDTLVISSSSVIAAGGDNVGNYIVISSTATTISVIKVTNTNTSCATVTAVPFSTNPTNDVQDLSNSATLLCQIQNIDNTPPQEQTIIPGPNATVLQINGTQVVRYAQQPFPSQNPALWALQLFPTDWCVGIMDINLTLVEQNAKTTTGTAKSVLWAQPNMEINLSSARVPPTRVYPVF